MGINGKECGLSLAPAPASPGSSRTALGKLFLPAVVLRFVYFYNPGGLADPTHRRAIIGCRFLDDYVVDFCRVKRRDEEREREGKNENRKLDFTIISYFYY